MGTIPTSPRYPDNTIRPEIRGFLLTTLPLPKEKEGKQQTGFLDGGGKGTCSYSIRVLRVHTPAIRS